jgi:hypothetical protein
VLAAKQFECAADVEQKLPLWHLQNKHKFNMFGLVVPRGAPQQWQPLLTLCQIYGILYIGHNHSAVHRGTPQDSPAADWQGATASIYSLCRDGTHQCDVSLGSLTPFLDLRTEERRLRQATALLLMRRYCNLLVKARININFPLHSTTELCINTQILSSHH